MWVDRLYYFRKATPLFSHLHSFWWDVCYHFYIISLYVLSFFSHGLLVRFSFLSLFFHQVDYAGLGVFSQIHGFIIFIKFGKMLAIIFFRFCTSIFSSLLLELQFYTCCCSVTKLCPTLCNPMGCSTPGFPAPHLSPGVCPSPLPRWCHPTISSSVTLFSCLQSH